VPVRSAADLKNSPQYRHRGFFHDVTHSSTGGAAYPGVPIPAERITRAHHQRGARPG